MVYQFVGYNEDCYTSVNSMLSGAPFSYDYVCLKVFRELFADNIILGGLFLPPAFGWQICIGFLIGLISH